MKYTTCKVSDLVNPTIRTLQLKLEDLEAEWGWHIITVAEEISRIERNEFSHSSEVSLDYTEDLEYLKKHDQSMLMSSHISSYYNSDGTENVQYGAYIGPVLVEHLVNEVLQVFEEYYIERDGELDLEQ